MTESENMKVLFVDDEPNILNTIKRGLMGERYHKYFATSGADALKIMENESIDIIVTDMKMPGMNGLELLKIVSNTYPDILKIVLSGYAQLPQILATVNNVDIYKFITKPWNMDEEFIPILRSAVHIQVLKKNKKIYEKSVQQKNEVYIKILKTDEDRIKRCKMDAQKHDDVAHLFMDQIKKTMTEKNMSKCLKIIELYEALGTTYTEDPSSMTYTQLISELEEFYKKMIDPSSEQSSHPKVQFIKERQTVFLINGRLNTLFKINELVWDNLIDLKNELKLDSKVEIKLDYEEEDQVIVSQVTVPKYLLTKDAWDLKHLFPVMNQLFPILGGSLEIHVIDDINVQFIIKFDFTRE